jgi:zona occludens toxin
MSIVIMTGAPGSGKSYSAIALTVYPALNLGRPIWTNVPLNETEIYSVWPESQIQYCDFREPGIWDSIPGGALVLIDEVWDLWPSGQRADKVPKDQQEFVAMHRHRAGPVGDKHLTVEIVLLSQGSTDLAKWVRSKIDKTYVVTKLDALGATSRYKLDIYQGCEDTARPRKGKLIRTLYGQYEPRFYNLYQSHTLTNETAAVNISELRADKGSSVWKSWRVVGGLVLGPILAIIGLGNAIAFLQGSEPNSDLPGGEIAAKPAETQSRPPEPERDEKGKPSESPAVEMPGDSSRSAPPSEPTVPISADWRLVAWLYSPDRDQYAVVVSNGSVRRSLVGVECVESYGEISCMIDGERVTFWSGSDRREAVPQVALMPK